MIQTTQLRTEETRIPMPTLLGQLEKGPPTRSFQETVCVRHLLGGVEGASRVVGPTLSPAQVGTLPRSQGVRGSGPEMG